MLPLLILIIPCILILLFLLALKPNSGRSQQFLPFEQTFIAHRGFFDNRSGCPENSCLAFEKAVNLGYGIELDVQLTKDEKLVVFHDASLKRMYHVDKKLSACTYEELQQYPLLDSAQRIPLFADVLSAVKGRVPLIIEVKPEGSCLKTARMLSQQLNGYSGIFCIESFHPAVVAWFKKHEPQMLRGILSTDYQKNKIKCNAIAGWFLTNLLFNWYAKPDFIAYNHKYVNQFSYRLCRKLYPATPQAAWTIRSQSELAAARKTYSIFIFDSFTPQD